MEKNKMKKYYKPDFKTGKAGQPKNAPSTNYIYNMGGGVISSGESGSGILSITISPALTLTPTLESMLPIEDFYESDVPIASAETLTNGDTYTVTATPSSDYYILVGDANDEDVVAIGNAPGESASCTITVKYGQLYFAICAYASMDDESPVAERTFLISANEN